MRSAPTKHLSGQQGYGGLGMLLGAVIVGFIAYFFIFPASFIKPNLVYDKSECYLDPQTSTQTIVDPKDGKTYVLIKPHAQSIRAQVDYHFARQGNVVVDGKTYPYYKVWIDAFSGEALPAFNPHNLPGRGGAGFRPTEGVDNLRFVDMSSDYPKLDHAYVMMDIYLLKDTPVPQFIKDYCDTELPVTPLLLIQDTYGNSIPPLEIDAGTQAEWTPSSCGGSYDCGPAKPHLKYILFSYEKKGSTSFATGIGTNAPVLTKQYTVTAAGKTATYNAYFLVNSSTETITLVNADATASDADIGYLYTRYELAPQIISPVDLHAKSPLETWTEHLEAFVPYIVPPWGWWTPECKPAVYLYPQKDMLVNVRVNIPNGFLTYTDPLYPANGWSVLAHPNGDLHYLSSNLQSSKGVVNYPTGVFPYLYYEGKIKDTEIQKPSTGFVKAYDQLPTFFDELLPKLGLNAKETTEFKQYWLKALPKAQYYYIGIIPQEQLDQNEPLTISPKQDTMIRVRLLFQQLDQPELIQEPTITTPKRNGFTVVDWGGMVKRDENHPFTCLQ